MIEIQLSERQEKIVDIVKDSQPITGENIAKILNLTRATIRPDLAILTMTGILDARPKVGYFYTGKSSFSLVSDRIKEIKVSDRKSIPIVVDEENNIYDSIVTMFIEDVSSIYVTSNNYLTGVISRKDFLKSAIGGIDINRTPVAMIMTRMPNIVTIEEGDSILEAAEKLIFHEIDSLPVVEKIQDENDEIKYSIIGRITKTNITRLFVELGNYE